MSRVRCALAACLAGLLLTVVPVPARAAAPDCDDSLADIAAAPRFEDDPAAIPRPARAAPKLLRFAARAWICAAH